MAAEPSFNDLLRDVTSKRQIFQTNVDRINAVDVTTIQGGFNTMNQLMSDFETMFKSVGNRIEQSEGAIIASMNRPMSEKKKYHGDAGNHKAIQSLKCLIVTGRNLLNGMTNYSMHCQGFTHMPAHC